MFGSEFSLGNPFSTRLRAKPGQDEQYVLFPDLHKPS